MNPPGRAGATVWLDMMSVTRAARSSRSLVRTSGRPSGPCICSLIGHLPRAGTADGEMIAGSGESLGPAPVLTGCASRQRYSRAPATEPPKVRGIGGRATPALWSPARRSAGEDSPTTGSHRRDPSRRAEAGPIPHRPRCRLRLGDTPTGCLPSSSVRETSATASPRHAIRVRTYLTPAPHDHTGLPGVHDRAHMQHFRLTQPR